MRNLTIRCIFFFLLLFNTINTGAQNTLFDIIYCINGGENKSVGIPSVAFPNPVEKPGWNLIFGDEFSGTSLDALKWNRSTPIDDGNGSCTRKFAVNPDNIYVSNGNAVITNTADELIPGCPFSSGEIKTMSVRDTTFKSTYFYANGFLEARVKLYSMQGQGAAMWLWGIGDPLNPGGQGPWNEIDVFELDGANANIADGTYHWTWDGKHTSQMQNVYLTEGSGLYDLSENWTTFALEWNADTIRWYINNVLVKELDLHRIPPFCLEAGHYSQALAPFCLRFGTGPNTVGNMTNLARASDLPQSMMIDYVRVYKKTGEKATPILTTDGISQVCFDTLNPLPVEKILWTPYYPEVTYEWSSPSFDISPLPVTIPRPPGRMLIRSKPGIAPNQFHPVYLKTTFPGNRSEFDTLLIYLPTTPPPLPQNNFSASQIDTLCYFEIRKPLSSQIEGAEYSVDGGALWKLAREADTPDGSFFCFDTIRAESMLTFRWREWNSCGFSPELQTTFIAPPPQPGCKWPLGTAENKPGPGMVSGKTISVLPCPVSTELTVNVVGSDPNDNQPCHLSIYDATGRLLTGKPIFHGTNTLDMNLLKPGFFFILITCGNEILFHGKCIKQ